MTLICRGLSRMLIEYKIHTNLIKNFTWSASSCFPLDNKNFGDFGKNIKLKIKDKW